MVTRRRTNTVFNVFNYMVLTIFSVLALIPFIIVLSGSLTDEKQLVLKGVNLIPRAFSFTAYTYIFNSSNFRNESILDAYKVTIFVTVVGSTLSVMLSAALAYIISIKSLRLRNHISFFVFFTTLFSGGMIPWYILCVRYLHLKNTIWALILPMLVNPFYVFIMKAYFKGIPDSLRESGIIDGAGEMRILFRIILPLALPVVAAVSLFYMLSYWNDFYQALFFIDKKELVPLQYHLYRILSTLNFLSSAAGREAGAAQTQHILLPSEGVRLATTIVTIGPIIFVYPFAQRFFIKGITIGAVKG